MSYFFTKAIRLCGAPRLARSLGCVLVAYGSAVFSAGYEKSATLSVYHQYTCTFGGGIKLVKTGSATIPWGGSCSPSNSEIANAFKQTSPYDDLVVWCDGYSGTGQLEILTPTPPSTDNVPQNCGVSDPEEEAPEPEPEPEPEPSPRFVSDNQFVAPGSAESQVGDILRSIYHVLNHSDVELDASQLDLKARVWDILFESDPRRQARALSALIPDNPNSRIQSQRSTGFVFLSNIFNRLGGVRAALKQSAEQLSMNPQSNDEIIAQDHQIAYSSSSETGGAAGDDITAGSSKWGFFIDGLKASGDKEQTEVSNAYGFEADSFTLGIDYLVDHNLALGVAVSKGNSEAAFSDNSGNLTGDAQIVSLYGTVVVGHQWFLDAVVGYGKSQYESVRKFDYVADGVEINQTAIGKPDASQALVSLGVTKSVSRKFEWDLSLRVNIFDARVEPFTETMDRTLGHGLALHVDEQRFRSLTSDISVSVSRAFSRNFGVLIPHATLTYTRELDGSTSDLNARFAFDSFRTEDSKHSGGDGFVIPAQASDINYGHLRLGLNLLFPRGITLTMNYSRVLDLDKTNTDYLSLGVNKSW